jgi:hypothetical protein
LYSVGRETPFDVLGAHLSKPVRTTWCPCPPGQTRIRYDGASYSGVNPYLTAKLGAGKKEEWGLPTGTVIGFRLPESLTKAI